MNKSKKLNLLVNDFVSVVNSSKIAKINLIYEIRTESRSTKKSTRLKVQWYNRPKNVPSDLLENKSIDFDKDIIEDHTVSEGDISDSVVSEKCHVIFGKITDSIDILQQQLGTKNANSKVFVCRYKLTETRKKLYLLPVFNKMDEIKRLSKQLDESMTMDCNESYNGPNYSIVEEQNKPENSLKIKLSVSKRSNRKLEEKNDFEKNMKSPRKTISHDQENTPKKKPKDLETSAQCLPGRETEYQNIFSFLQEKIADDVGGCMYINGVPGTGKTATVSSVVSGLKFKAAKGDIQPFQYIEVNAMTLTEPKQVYARICKELTGKTCGPEQALTIIEKKLLTPSSKRTVTILLIDELDVLCNRRQDIVYNLLDWPGRSSSKLVVIAIANAMDLPERILQGKINSRLGLTRLTFYPYQYKQLENIINRIEDSLTFKSEAVQLVARKVAAVSGDARRAIDIFKNAIDEAKNEGSKSVEMVHVEKALETMISSLKIEAIQSYSVYEKIFLEAVCAEVNRRGIEEVVFKDVYAQLVALTAFQGLPDLSPGNALGICSKLGSSRILICEHSRKDIFQKIILNVSTDDIYFAISNQKQVEK